MLPIRQLTICLAVALLTLGGCCCVQEPACGHPWPGDEIVAIPEPYPPAQRTTAWLYLAAKHDKDGDGVITAEEYGRGPKAFANLDRDGNGKVTASDVGHGPIHAHVVKATLLRYFQDDERPMDVTRDELKAGFAKYDSNADGKLSAKEFAIGREAFDDTGKSVIPKMVGGMDVHRSMRLETGSDDGRVHLSALMAYFDKMTAGAGVFTMPPPRARPPGAKAPPAAAAEGEPAPDFTLQPPGGGTPVTLSAFRGKRPVALIFGSYT